MTKIVKRINEFKKVDELFAAIDELVSIPDKVNEIEDERDSYSLSLIESGWTEVAGLSPDQLHRIATDGYTSSEVDDLMICFYDKDEFFELRKLVLESICSTPHFSRWEKLIIECLHSYTSGRFMITIPSLISIVEGSLALEIGIIDKPDIKIKKPIRENASNDNIHRAMKRSWLSISKYIDIIFDGDFKCDQPDHISRNWVMHGRYVYQGDEQLVSLKLFNLLGTIAMVTKTDEEYW